MALRTSEEKDLDRRGGRALRGVGRERRISVLESIGRRRERLSRYLIAETGMPLLFAR
jgi:hypothetical protein